MNDEEGYRLREESKPFWKEARENDPYKDDKEAEGTICPFGDCVVILGHAEHYIFHKYGAEKAKEYSIWQINKIKEKRQ